MLRPDELLDAVADSLRHQVGPAVGDPFARTQAFMAAVILQKLAGQLRAPETDVEPERRQVVADLRAHLAPSGPTLLVAAVDELERDGTPAAWRAVVEALYAGRDELGAERFDDVLGRVRTTLRSRLDRGLAAGS